MKKLVILFPLLICLVQVFCQIPLKEKSNMDLSKVVFSPSSRFCFLAFGHEAIVCNSSGETIAEFKTPDAILAIAFSPDERFISTAESSGRLAIWDTKGKLIKSQNGSRLWLSHSAITYSPDGTKLVHGKDDNTAFLLNSNGDFIAALDHSRRDPNSVSIAGGYDGRSPLQGSHNKEITFVKFSPDGSKIFTSSQDSSAFLWDKNGKLLSKIKNPYGVIQILDFAKDGKFISGHKDGRVVLWDNKGIFIRVIEKLEQPIIYTQFSSDGNYSYATDDATLVMRKMSGEIIRKYNLDTNPFLRLHAVSPDGKLAMYMVNRKELLLTNLSSKAPFTKALNTNIGPISSIDISPNRNFFVTASKYGSATLWDTTGTQIHVFDDIEYNLTSTKFSTDGNSIFIGSLGRDLIQRTLNGNLIHKYQGHEGSILAVAVSPNGQFVLTGSIDKTAILWKVNGQALQKFTGHNETVSAVAFSPNGNFLVTGSTNGTCILWDIKGALIQKLTSHKGTVNCIVFDKEGKHIFTGGDDKSIIQQDFKGNLLRHYTGAKSPIIALTLSPDGTKIISGGYSDLNEWSLDENMKKQTLSTNQRLYSACSFSADGNLLITGSESEIVLWNKKLQPQKNITIHHGRIESLFFEQGGNQIVTLGSDNKAIFWNFSGKIEKSIDLAEFSLGHTPFDKFALSSDRKKIFACNPFGSCVLYNDSLKLIGIFNDATITNFTAISPNGQYLLNGNSSLFTLRETSNLYQPSTFPGLNLLISSVAFSPDNQLILLISSDGAATLIDNRGKFVQRIGEKSERFLSGAFSPDGQKILLGSLTGMVSIWDLSGKNTSTFKAGYLGIESISYSPSGKSIFTINMQGEAKRWDDSGNSLLFNAPAAKSLFFSKDGKYVAVVRFPKADEIIISELTNE